MTVSAVSKGNCVVEWATSPRTHQICFLLLQIVVATFAADFFVLAGQSLEKNKICQLIPNNTSCLNNRPSEVYLGLGVGIMMMVLLKVLSCIQRSELY